MSETGKFIGPLTEDSLVKAGEDFGIYFNSDIAKEIARERTGREVAQLALADAIKETEAYKVDGMTGFLGRDAFLDEVQSELAQLRRDGMSRKSDKDSALFIMLDIIGLHELNKPKNGGHPNGDRAIKATADFIRLISRLEDGDIAGRLGGDEFAVYLSYSHNDINHSQMTENIKERVSKQKKVCQNLGLSDVPPIRYRYAHIDAHSPLPSVELLLELADPKKRNTQPIIV